MALTTITVTASQVTLLSGRTGQGVAGEDLLRGQWVYIDHSDGDRIKLANADDNKKIDVVGMVVNDVNSNGTVRYALPGSEVDPGFAPVAGESYILADTDGAISVIKQAATESAHKVHLGYGNDADRLTIAIVNTRVNYTWT